MTKSFRKSKLIVIGLASLGVWFVAFCYFIASLFLARNDFGSIIQDVSYVFRSPLLIGSLVSFLLGIISFLIGTMCVALLFARNMKRKHSSLRGKLLFSLKFFLIFAVLPFYALRKIRIRSASVIKKRTNRVLAFTFALFVFVPIWFIGYLLVGSITAYSVSSVFGYAPVIEPVSGTGSMYPTFPKGTGKTDKENANQVVVTPIFMRYPGGIKLFGKQLFNRELERGDIITFSNKATDEATKKQYGTASPYVKRVIGLPGDTLELRGGLVYLNNKPLKEPYTSGPYSTFAGSYLSECTKFTVPSGKVFVMGDNRKGSSDSREIGLVDLREIKSVLSLGSQKREWDKNWRDTNKDFDTASKTKINRERYLALLNEKRKAAGVPELTYDEKLEQSAQKRGEIILRFDDFSFEASRSGYTVDKAMSDSGYFNPFYGESPSQGYYTAEELIENQFAFPDSQAFLLERDYDEVGIAEIEGEINGCPTQIIVQHYAGYVPPNYTQADIQSWQEALANLQSIQPGWISLKDTGSFYQEHKADIDRINELIAQRIANASTVLVKMQANQWLNSTEQNMVNQDISLANEINAIGDRLNSL